MFHPLVRQWGGPVVSVASVFFATCYGYRETPSSATRGQDVDDDVYDDVYDVGIVGGGIVGLSVARECAVRGYSVVLLEREDVVSAAASSGNSGLGCS